MSNRKQTTSVTPRAYRDVMGLFATGVTVVAAQVEGKIHGMTANAITSVSLDPLLILVCVQKDAAIAKILQETNEFSMSILNEDQEQLSNFFAGIWPEGADPPPFGFEPWHNGGRLQGAMGALACKIDKFLDGGDHWIITALVIDLYAENTPANPLLYYRGQYRRFLEG
ncbi:MAG: flavin reductase family protein [Anaerolineae bacterium]|nr:flavin reductase family protein [Anaerolineae bacterium]